MSPTMKAVLVAGVAGLATTTAIMASSHLGDEYTDQQISEMREQAREDLHIEALRGYVVETHFVRAAGIGDALAKTEDLTDFNRMGIRMGHRTLEGAGGADAASLQKAYDAGYQEAIAGQWSQDNLSLYLKTTMQMGQEVYNAHNSLMKIVNADLPVEQSTDVAGYAVAMGVLDARGPQLGEDAKGFDFRVTFGNASDEMIGAMEETFEVVRSSVTKLDMMSDPHRLTFMQAAENINDPFQPKVEITEDLQLGD